MKIHRFILGLMLLCLFTPHVSGQTIITVAGTGTSGYSGDGGPATSARVNLPTAICRDFYGNIYVADRFNHRVRKIDLSGTITTIAGTGVAGFLGDGGPAVNARLNQPIGVVVDMDGNVYISDNSNERIRKVDTTGVITTIAGTGVAGFLGDGGPAINARLNDPWGLCVDKLGNLYVADRINNRVRKIDVSTGVITTVAGTGTAGYSGEGGLATAANFDKPIAICVDTMFNLFIADEENERVRKVTYATGIVTKIAGTGTAGYNGDGGAAVSAQLNKPCGVAIDLAGNVYISDRMNHRLRKINTSGNISTIAGTGVVGYSGDGGPATSARINFPRELFSDGSGNIYFADTDNDRVRKITYCEFPTIPVVAASPSTTVCEGTTVTLSVGSGNLNDATEWKWYTGTCGGTYVGSGTSINVNPAVTTNYFVRGEGGCVTPYACASITINVNPLPAQPLSIFGNTSVCENSSETYSITPVAGASGYTWTLPAGWSGSSTSASINVVPSFPGDTVFVSSYNSCGSSAPQILVVNVNPLPSVNASASPSSIVCQGESIVLSGSGASTYSWTGGVTNAVPFTPSATTTYTVTGTDGNGCTQTNTILVTVNNLPSIGVTASPSPNVCLGEILTLSGTGASGYTWTGGIMNGISFTALTTETYTVTGTDMNGCSNTSSITITVHSLPIVNGTANPSGAICNGDNITLNGSGANTYSWTGGVVDNIPFMATLSATYTVTGTDMNGCSSTSAVSITVNPLPIVDAGNDQSVCQGGSVLLGGSGAITYSWDNSVTDNVPFIPTTTLLYIVTGTDANNCSNTDTVMVTVHPLPSVDGGPDQTSCHGDSIILSGIGAVSYTWTGGISNNLPFLPTVTTSYTVTGTDINGCTDTDTVMVIIGADPAFSLGPDIIQATPPALVSAGSGWSTVLWNTGSTLSTISIDSNATLICTVTNADGCEATDTISVWFTAGDGSQESNPVEMILYPVPNDGILYLQLTGLITTELVIEIFDITGRLVYIRKGGEVSGIYMQAFDLSEFDAGLYTVQLCFNGQLKQQRFIKK